MVLTALLKEREERTKLLDQQIKEKDALIQKLKQERIDSIRGLLADGLSVELVMKYSHLSAEEIKQIARGRYTACCSFERGSTAPLRASYNML